MSTAKTQYASEGWPYSRMIVREGIIQRDVLEIPANMVVEETLHLRVLVLRIHEDRPNIGFHNIREAL